MKTERELTVWQTHQRLDFRPLSIYPKEGTCPPKTNLYETQFLVKQGEGKKRVEAFLALTKNGGTVSLEFLSPTSGLILKTPIVGVTMHRNDLRFKPFSEARQSIPADTIVVTLSLSQTQFWQVTSQEIPSQVIFVKPSAPYRGSS